MTSQKACAAAEDLEEPFRVRYRQHDLGLHLDIRVCLLRAKTQEEANIIVISDNEENDKSEKAAAVCDKAAAAYDASCSKWVGLSKACPTVTWTYQNTKNGRKAEGNSVETYNSKLVPSRDLHWVLCGESEEATFLLLGEYFFW